MPYVRNMFLSIKHSLQKVFAVEPLSGTDRLFETGFNIPFEIFETFTA